MAKAKALLSVCVCFFPSLLLGYGLEKQILKSPDGHVRLITEFKGGRATYGVYFNGHQVIGPSAIAFEINSESWGVNIAALKREKYTINESYAMNGVHSIAVNYCNGEKISLVSGDRTFILEARAFNNGIAFRYIVNNTGSAVVNKDNTEFAIPAGTDVWSQPNIKYYEGQYTKRGIGDFKPGDLAGPPLTLELPSDAGYAAITEGGLVDFAGMSLIANGHDGFTANLAGLTRKAGEIVFPWRIIEIGKDLNALVSCDIVTNVSPPDDSVIFPQGSQTEWIKPGKSVWSWLAPEHEITLKNMKHFTDMAAQLGFEYNLVDEGWGNWKDGGRDKWALMKELVDYSAKKGVKIWVWKAYPDRNGIDGINTPEKRNAFFKKCAQTGIVGLKVDFFDSEEQEIIDFYQVALKDAAEYRLMMDFHGANKPTGENRTWPNELSREAIRGLEHSPPWAKGNTILPFTRFLAGPADFTPVHFGTKLGDMSWAHTLATMVVFTSPFMCLGADPQGILANPSKEIIKNLPVTWDETLVLPQSKIGELVLMARRKDKTWYVAGLNGLDRIKALSLPLSFLQKGGYAISIFKDDPEKQDNLLIDQMNLSAGEAVDLQMNPAGGFVIKIEKIN